MRPDDKATMKLVLAAAPEINSNYSIIISKLHPKAIKHLTENADELITLLATLNDGLPGTTSIHYFTRNDELEEAANIIIPLEQNLKDFIDNASEIVITSKKVDKIACDEFDGIKEELATQLHLLYQEKEFLLQKVEEQNMFLTQQLERGEKKNNTMISVASVALGCYLLGIGYLALHKLK